MKKLWQAFGAGFLAPFFVITLALFGATNGFSLLDGHVLIQCLFLITAVSLLTGIFTSVSSLMQESSPEQTGLGREISEEAGLFFHALRLLRGRAFFPFWIALATILLGLMLPSRLSPLAGTFVLLTGQAFWLWSRRGLRARIDSAPINNFLHPYLVWIFRAMDGFALITAVEVMGTLGSYGEITDNIPLIVAAALIAGAFVAYGAKRKQERLEIDHALKGGAIFVWAALIIATLNFGFDFRTPSSVVQLNYSECSEYQGSVLSGKSAVREEMKDCYYFSRLRNPQSDTVINILNRRGAFGFGWKQMQL